ncbi:PadR family transcriptional regulator [candidate division KSB1 bacterium]|nr:PadR family transcriptional regulator [candidate division KSB1 bacterium]
MKNNETYKQQLLKSWEDTYKKGQLTFWLFLSLKENPKYVNEIKDFIETKSNNTITCEGQSLYRTLRKYHDLEMVDFNTGKGNKGPERKYYYLTTLGHDILNEFIERNIKLFFNENLTDLILSKGDNNV